MLDWDLLALTLRSIDIFSIRSFGSQAALCVCRWFCLPTGADAIAASISSSWNVLLIVVPSLGIFEARNYN